MLNSTNIRSLKHYLGFGLVSLLAILFTSCSPRIHKESSKPAVFYPVPPAEARIQYLTSISTSEDVHPKRSAFVKSVVGEERVLSIGKPYGVFLHSGKLYVCDLGIGGGLNVIDLEKKEFNYFIPRGQHRLKSPLNCYVDTNGHLYVVDLVLQKVMVYDADENFVTSLGKKENVKPTDVFVSEKKVWVTDFGNHRVNVYNKKTQKFEYYFPKLEKGEEGFLYKPTNMFVTKDKVYVSDMGQSDVKIYTHKGKYIETVGTYGKNLGEFVRPKGIAVDRESNLFVVDSSFENVQIFNDEGKLLLFFGGQYHGPGDMWLPTKVMIDYDNLKYFKEYVNPKYNLEYLIIVANQYGPDKISIYGRITPKNVTTKSE